MYNYKFYNEEIINKAENINIKINNNYYITNFILTDKKLLVFQDINRGKIIWGSGTQNLPNYELLFEIPLSELNYYIKSDNLIIFINNIEVNCYDFDMDEFLKKR